MPDCPSGELLQLTRRAIGMKQARYGDNSPGQRYREQEEANREIAGSSSCNNELIKISCMIRDNTTWLVDICVKDGRHLRDDICVRQLQPVEKVGTLLEWSEGSLTGPRSSPTHKLPYIQRDPKDVSSLLSHPAS
ncbi:hypothetical protein RRG08_012296 [Elysia crispata]|uniref:Uncharacterized protein n=1 Tax=Elysia crispata TaxID=231223 RepID=A0AAE1BCK5_9GAST|nr:hypothetical protein RRG08_012296 [Elysia crispata]